MKLPIPSSKLQRNPKLQIKSCSRRTSGRNAEPRQTYREFKLAYYNEIGKRTLQSFNSFKKARKAADNVNVSLMKGEVKSLVLSNDDKVVYLRALKALKSTGTALDVAAYLFAELVKVLGGASPLEAARYYIHRHPTKLPRKTVREVVEEFIGSRRQAKRSEEYVEDLEYRLGRFAKAFQTCIAEVSQSDVVRFLSSLGRSAVGAGVHRTEAMEDQDRSTPIGSDPPESGTVAGPVCAKEWSGLGVR